MLIKILVTVVGLFLLISLESFFATLLSFSIFIIVLLILIDKLNWKQWVLLSFLATVIVDILLHRVIGVTLLVTALSAALLYSLFFLIPKKEVFLSYVPYFFSILLFYILLDLIAPFVQDRIWGTLTGMSILGDVIRSALSTVLIFIINLLVDNFRAKDSLTL